MAGVRSQHFENKVVSQSAHLVREEQEKRMVK